jgi:Zn-dependent protease
MKWSWKLGSVAGIGVYVHATFLILIAWIGAGSWFEGGSAADVAADIGFIVALFGCVLLHELGHALTARRYDIQTRDITLLPIGGLARLERMPEEPRQELVVALAGPAVNGLIAGALWLALDLLGAPGVGPELDLLDGPFAARLLVVNLFIALFNLLPAFPMDGGRILRALLATRMDYVGATQVAANIGQAMALGFGLVGLMANPFLVFIAFFVWIGAAAEASMVQVKSALAGIPVAHAMLTEFETLRSDDPLERAIALTLATSQKDFPVIDAGGVAGVLTQERLLRGLEEKGRAATVGSICETGIGAADSHEMLEGVLARIESQRAVSVPVTHGNRLVGMLTLDNVGELIRIQAALGKDPLRAR